MLSIDTIKNRINLLYNSNSGLHIPIRHILLSVDDNTIYIYNLINDLTIYLNKSTNQSYELLEIADIFNIIYLANKTIYNLPDLLNNKFINNKPNTHLIFGEDMTLLSCLGMSIDSGYELVYFIKKYYPEKLHIIRNINKIYENDSNSYELDINIFTNNKYEIKQNYNNQNNILIKMIYKFMGYFYELNDDDYKKLMDMYTNNKSNHYFN